MSPNALKDFGSRIRQNLDVLRRAGQRLATSATSFALFLRDKIGHGWRTLSNYRSSRKPLKITNSDVPMSAAMAAQSEAKPANVKATKRAFTASENVMF